jgi:hypothetical protein
MMSDLQKLMDTWKALNEIQTIDVKPINSHDAQDIIGSVIGCIKQAIVNEYEIEPYYVVNTTTDGQEDKPQPVDNFAETIPGMLVDIDPETKEVTIIHRGWTEKRSVSR